jgi:hypothetical protein
MRLYLDTEFTDFIDSELISIGIVDENGREFYAERNDFPREECSAFVNEIVIPLLGQNPDGLVLNRYQMVHALLQWLQPYRDGGAIICVDYATDWHLFIDLMAGTSVMEFITAELIWTDLDQQRISDWWKETGLPQHHALYDARANRHGYDPKNGYDADNG